MYKNFLYLLIGLNILIIILLCFQQLELMFVHFDELLASFHLISIIISAGLSGAVTIGLVFLFRPKIKVPNVAIIEQDICNSNSKKIIKINVKNQRLFSSACNIKIEATFINESDQTFHLKLDRKDFLLIKPRDNRNFQSDDIKSYTKKVTCSKNLQDLLYETKDICVKFRVRIHAEHSLTGFGRVFEYNFTKNKDDCFQAH